MKYLAAQMIIRPVFVHIFLRNGRNEQGEIVHRQTVAKSLAILKYLEETRQTFESIQPKGGFDVTEIAHLTPIKDCIDRLIQKLKKAGKTARLILMEDGVCHSPWTLEGEKSVTIE